MKKSSVIIVFPLCLLYSSYSYAQPLNSLTCVVTEKVYLDDGKLQSYPKSYFEKYKPSVRIIDTGSSAILQRCDFKPDLGQTECDSYKVDHVERTQGVNITKFYHHRGQLDVQVFANMLFIENNGRGSFGFGKCSR